MRHRAGETERGPSRRLRIGVGAAAVLLIAAFVVAALLSGLNGGRTVPLPVRSPVGDRSGVLSPSPGATAAGGNADGSELFIHVSGAVGTPGLVRLAPGSRVVDAVGAAGGFAEGADPAGVNLARLVRDGEQLRVPLIGEGPASVDSSADGGAAAGSADGSADGLLDMNTATAAQLETLPRIGPALAQRILDWRASNGRFAAVTDLLKITGIGQKLFDGLKDRVTV